MAQFEPYRDEIKSLGATLVYVAAEKRSGMFKPLEYLQKNEISYAFLFDEDRTVTKSYGVYHRIGLDAVNIARPATFVIGGDGIIRYIFVGSTQHERAPIDDVLAAVRALKSSE